MPARELHEDDAPDWTHAKCGNQQSDYHFPDRGTAQTQALAAKAICNGQDGGPVCPIRQECGDYAIAINERFGVWGGMSERDRARERARRIAVAKKKALAKAAAAARRAEKRRSITGDGGTAQGRKRTKVG